MWPGLATYRIAVNGARGITSQEIVDEIDTIRVRELGPGHIHFSMTALMKSPDSLDAQLAQLYAQPGIVLRHRGSCEQRQDGRPSQSTRPGTANTDSRLRRRRARAFGCGAFERM